MTTFTMRCDAPGTGVRVAVKDLIDMVGLPTTAGCRAVADLARPATTDAPCLAGTRSSARIVGRTNLHELALGVTGVNPWFGTPVNPLDPQRVPGGSSSGAAVAVVADEADVAWGSDTGGSVRIPAACCGCTGLKTTWGRIPLEGVWPLAPSLDTVGPLARDISGLVAGMGLLDPTFTAMVGPATHLRVGRLSLRTDPAIDAAIDRALQSTGWDLSVITLPTWDAATDATRLLLGVEAWQMNHALAERYPDKIGADVLLRLRAGRDATAAEISGARAVARRWRAELATELGRVDVIATPTIAIFPPLLERGDDLLSARCTLPVNLAGVPALAVPVAVPGSHLPASLQLIGPTNGEALLLAAGAVVEAVAGVA